MTSKSVSVYFSNTPALVLKAAKFLILFGNSKLLKIQLNSKEKKLRKTFILKNIHRAITCLWDFVW